jgi:hypothetical protein
LVARLVEEVLGVAAMHPLGLANQGPLFKLAEAQTDDAAV